MRPLKLQWSETEDKKKIPNTYMYEVLSLNILIMKRREGVCLKKYSIKLKHVLWNSDRQNSRRGQSCKNQIATHLHHALTS